MCYEEGRVPFFQVKLAFRHKAMDKFPSIKAKENVKEKKTFSSIVMHNVCSIVELASFSLEKFRTMEYTDQRFLDT